MKVVGVIGAGASGLCAARHILATEGLTPVVWEQAQDLGGTWRLSTDIGKDSRGFPVHSSMYHSLRTNLPALLMNFPDFKLPKEETAYLHHTSVLKYLEDYAQRFDLLPCIKFGHHVMNVSPVEGGKAWRVTVKDLATGLVTTTSCDALLVCNGHNSEPNFPHIEDIEKFRGQTLHSHDYREPKPYAGSRVVVLGAATSGLDISLEVSTVAKEVFLSHRLPLKLPTELPSNLRQVQGVVKATEDGFILSDGTSIKADAIVYCTGYKFKFPFLGNDCCIQVRDNRVSNLYKHIFNVKYPTMGFIGLPTWVSVFTLIHYQVQYFVATLTGKVTLPTQEEMVAINQEIDQERREKELPDKRYHALYFTQFQYMEEMAKEASVELPPTFQQKLFNIIGMRQLISFPTFKKYHYRLAEDGSIVETKGDQIISTRWDLARLAVTQATRYIWTDFPGVVSYVGVLMMTKVKKFLRYAQ